MLIINFILIAVIIILSYYLYESRQKIKLLRHLKPRDLWLIRERIKMMSPRDFEVFCGCLFRMLGYKAGVTKATKDGGKDIILFKDGKYIFAECKHWKDCIVEGLDEEGGYSSSSITQDIAQKLRGAMDYGFDGKKSIEKGIIITTTRFSEQCQKYCNAMNIEMIDIDRMMELIKQIGTTSVYTVAGIDMRGELI